MEIRFAREDDREKVLEFCRDTFSWGDYIAEVWEKWYRSGNLHVCEQDGLVVGMYHIEFIAGGSWLEGMRVRPQFRKKGLGTRMMLHAESVIQKGTVRLVVESENHPSINLVKSVGYRIEEMWRLYGASPQQQKSSAKVASSVTWLDSLVGSVTYAESWRWHQFGKETLERLVRDGRVLVYADKGGTEAVGIWNRSEDFPQTFQVGYVNGSREGVEQVLMLAQGMAQEKKCERIQVFALENTPFDLGLLEKKSKFYLMRKELGKIYNP